VSEGYPEKFDTWREHFQHRTESRVDVALTKNLRILVKERAEKLGVSVSVYVRECVRHFIYHHPTDADPRR
jgi:hypothetical protein